MLQHFGRFGTPEVVHTDRGTAFHNELITELLRVAGTEQSLTTAYSKEENAIVERANKEVLRHLNALLFYARVYDRWAYEKLPMVQRIMNTVEKTSTGVTPAELILNNGIRLQARILAPPTSLSPTQWMNGSRSNAHASQSPSARPVTAGNPTKLGCTWTISTTTSVQTQ